MRPVPDLTEARRLFYETASLPDGLLPPSILQSWRRCRSFGLPMQARTRNEERLEATELARRREASADWLSLARPQVDTLFEQVVDDGLVVVVADGQGLILDELGHPAFLDRAERLALTPGMAWGETIRGTNAIGTALALADPVLVRGGEHYLERNRTLACAASPILDPFGQPVGVVDVSGPPRRVHAGRLQQVDAAVRLIEQRLFDVARAGWMTLALHPDASQLATPRAGRLAFDAQERLCAADRRALGWLGRDFSAIGHCRFADLFGETLSHWLSRSGQATGRLTTSGGLLSARLLPQMAPAASLPSSSRATPPRPVSANPAGPRGDAAATLAGLAPQWLARAVRLLEADIPVLVLGETGVGKDRFAQALHAASSRAARPFVAVNCAALPEGLVEAELFGYEEGAFTGARRQGSRGRLREAHGGVVFLDEIGDMPLAVQARLLRVLQERVVCPLGGGAPQPVDIRLVCATHRDLKAMVAEGSFRADLYYRLCHHPFRLPPLRARGDVGAIALALWQAHGGHRRNIVLSADLLALFRRYAWPGNLRELDNLLRTLLALYDDGTVLAPRDLPDTLREEMEDAEPAQPLVMPASVSALEAHLARHQGNMTAAARALGISRSTLYRRMARERA